MNKLKFKDILNFFEINIPVFLISFYQTFLSFDKGALSYLAPGGACKYSLSCSEYTKQAIISEGFFKGITLGTKRIISCR